ncbi:MAG TPA: LPS assembly lipoprotein LptE [Longimicrobiales bacterium]
MTRSLALLLGVLAAGACNYGFRGGGGFPASIRTIYIEPFENETVHFELQELIYQELFTELPRALGVRPAGREVADAIVRGRIIGYDDVAKNYRAGDSMQTSEVLEHEVQVSIAIEIIDTQRNLILWESSRLTGKGSYLLASQQYTDGRAVAIEELARLVVDGAQSQW